MKHIFFINSSITYLISLGVITKNKINIDDVLFLSEKFTSKYLPIKPTSIIKEITKKKQCPFLILNKVKLVDNFIKEHVVSDGFNLYIQHALDRQKIFMTHPSCKDISFIEEGFSNYFMYDSLMQFSANKRNLPWRLNSNGKISQIKKDVVDTLNGFSSKMRDLPTWAPSYNNLKNVCYYCVSQQAFPGIAIEKKSLIDLNVINKYWFENLNIPRYSNELIWIGDNLVKGYKVPESEYLEGISNFVLEYLGKSGNDSKKIILKFHQGESRILRTKVTQVMNKIGLQCTTLEDGIPIEIILLSSANCHLLGIMSSLLYYGSLMNHKVFSGINYLPMQKHFSFEDLSISADSINFI